MQYFGNRNYSIIGIGDNFNGDASMQVRKRRSRNWIAKLSPAKPGITVLTRDFVAFNDGIELLAGEFYYFSQFGFLEIINIEDDCIGMELHASNSTAIPVNAGDTSDIARTVTTIHSMPTEV